MMKTTIYLLSVLASILFSTQIYATQYPDSSYIEDNLILPKRVSSLSIVNPLDVLRQRVMLEMARRQMRENTKQIEVNKAYLKQIGKRTGSTKQIYIPDSDTENYLNNFDDERPKDINTGQGNIPLNFPLRPMPNKGLKANRIVEPPSPQAYSTKSTQKQFGKSDDNSGNYLTPNDYHFKYIYSLHQNRYNQI